MNNVRKQQTADSMKGKGKKIPSAICYLLSTDKGFSMVELLITMVVFVFVMAAGSQIFSGLLTQFKQQSKIAETNIEGVIGLEILRQDIEHAGYGLPFVIPSGLTYQEAINSPTVLPYSPADYNEITAEDTTTTSPPRAVLSGDGAGLNESDVLIIKAANVSQKVVTQKWTHLTLKNGVITKKTWDVAGENFAGGDYVMALTTGATDANMRALVVSGGSFFRLYSSVNDFAPGNATEARYVYGLHDSEPRMPFNRADYYLSGTNVPQRCAPNTGVLMKSIISHANGALDTNEAMPLLDCVADMQVIYRIDRNGDGIIDGTSNTIAALTDTNSNGAIDAAEIRQQIKEVRVYILAHEGQRDVNYTYPNDEMTVGEFGLGRTFILKTMIGDPDYQNYRWRLYTMVVQPNNLR